MDTSTSDPLSDASMSEPSSIERSHRRRKYEIILVAIALVVLVLLSAALVGELRWRWRRFLVDWT
jgi:hypothetical protein